MTRVDVPTLMCDRCGNTTQDTNKMYEFQHLTYYHMSGKDVWDLCPDCFNAFKLFIGGNDD